MMLLSWKISILSAAAGLALACASLPVAAQSSSGAGAEPPRQIEIPAPKSMTMSARRLQRGELAILDPIDVTVAPLRTEPTPIPPPTPGRITVNGSRIDPSLVAIPDPLTATATILRRPPLDPPELRDPVAGAFSASRGTPPEIEIGDPFPMSFAGNRIPLDVSDAQAALDSCDFEAVREHLRRLVALSDQIDSEGRRVVGELSRVNRANSAFETARARYNEGRLDDARALLDLAGGTDCAERDAAIATGLDKVERLGKAIASIDDAVAACDVPAMSAMQRQLADTAHPALVARRNTLAAMRPAAEAAEQLAGKVDDLLAQGRLDEARGAQRSASEQLDRLPDPATCTDLRDRVAAQGTEIERITGLMAEVDETIRACVVLDMNALREEIADETNVLLVDKRQALDSVRLPAAEAIDLLAEGRRQFVAGELVAAEERLREADVRLGRIADESLCTPIRQDIASTTEEIRRVRGLMGETQSTIAACSAGDLARMAERLEGETHTLLVAQREAIARVRRPIQDIADSIERAGALFDEGNLDSAEARLDEARERLAGFSDISECAPVREQITRKEAEIAEVRRQLAAADRAIAVCEASTMRSIASDMQTSDHRLLVAKREELLALAEPIAEAQELNQSAAPYYANGLLDQAEGALRDALARISDIDQCKALGEQASQRLDRIDRMRGVLERVDNAVAACNIPAMTAMANQLDGQSHKLFVERAERIAAVNGPATRAETLRRQAARALANGNLKQAKEQYEAASAALADVDASLCGEIREDANAQLARIAEISDTLEAAGATLAACNLPQMREMSQRLDGRSYVLLAAQKQKLDAVIAPLERASHDYARARPLYESGDLGEADELLQSAARDLARIEPELCMTLRGDIAGLSRDIATVRERIAQSDQALAACDIRSLDRLSEQLKGAEHSLLRSKGAEIEAYAKPVRAARSLGEVARKLYFEGNLEGAETRLIEARKELGSRPACGEMLAQVDRQRDRITRMREVLSRVDLAIAGCHIPAMTSMSQQLAGQSHVLLNQKKAGLDRVADPAATALRLSREAGPLFDNGQLVAAETRLQQALSQLDQIDRALCLPLRREIRQQLEETDRIRSTLLLVDTAIQACNHADIDLLAANLANATHVALKRAYQDLRAGRLRCGLSEAERREQAEATCRQKHPNSVVSDFDPVSGRYTCVCPEDFVWDAQSASCQSRVQVQADADRVCQSGYPNSRAVNLRSPSQFECNCREGFLWNRDETACVPADEVVQAAIETCAQEGGYPVEIEGAGRFVCCPQDTVWDKSRRACVKESEGDRTGVAVDPQCRWIADTSAGASDSYICTCDPVELCGPRPGSTASAPAAPAGGTAVAGEAAPATPAPDGTAEGGDGDVMGRLRKFFGKMF